MNQPRSIPSNTANARKSYVVAKAAEIPPGGRKIVEVAGRSIGVFNVKGRFYALLNRCPHQGAPLCLGKITGTNLPSPPGRYIRARDGEILRCPWHGWEFDLTNGRSIFNPHRCRVRAYPVEVRPGVPAPEPWPDDQPDPTVESFPVTVDDADLVIHI